MVRGTEIDIARQRVHWWKKENKVAVSTYQNEYWLLKKGGKLEQIKWLRAHPW
jgi:hypothetical protein